MFKEKFVYTTVYFMTAMLNRRAFLIFAKIVAILYYVIGVRSKSIVKSNLRNSHIKFSIKLYLNFAHFLAECVFLMNNELDSDIFEVHNIEVFDRAIALGRGVMAMTMHMGGWDVAGQYLSYKGYPINVIYEPKDEWIYKYIDEIRRKYGIHFIDMKSPVWDFIKVLSKGEILFVLIDQRSENTHLKKVRFLNIVKNVPYGWYRLLKASKAAAIFSYTVYDHKDKKHHLYFENAEDWSFEDYYRRIEEIANKDIYQYDFYDRIWQDISN
ncbi:MAG: lysophospholipid acyltransferase family protein [bacterium]